MGEETWIGLAIGISTLAIALPTVLAHYWREQNRARLLRNFRRHAAARADNQH